MAWAGIWDDKSTEIQFLQKDPEAPRGGCSQHSYLAMLKDQIPQFYTEGMLFQQDNARIHITPLVLTWLDETGIARIDDWPPYSPDLSPIEHIWSELRDCLLRYYDDKGSISVEGRNQEEKVQRALTAAFDDVSEWYIHRCTSSFLKRLDAVIAAEGWYTKY